MQGKTRWLALILTVALTTVSLGASAGADSGSEQGFLSAINSTRSSAGLGSVKMDSGLQAHARTHTAYMIDGNCADGKPICHSSSSAIQAAAGSGWSKLGENVGRGGNVSSLHQAFLDSPSHKANMLGDYNYVGIGTDTSEGILYVTVVFMKKGSTDPAPTTTTTTAPAPTTTTAPASPGPKQTTDEPAPAKQENTEKPDSPAEPPATTTTTAPPSTTTTLVVGPDKAVTPGESCYAATLTWWMCHD
jgi:hypothetical protein